MKVLIFFTLVALCQSSSLYSSGEYSGGNSIWRYLLNRNVGVGYQPFYGQDYPYEYGVGERYYNPTISREIYQDYPYGAKDIWSVLGRRYDQGLYSQQYPYAPSYVYGKYQGSYEQPYGYYSYPYGERFPYVYSQSYYGQNYYPLASFLRNYLQRYQGQYIKYPYGIGQSRYYGSGSYQPVQQGY